MKRDVYIGMELCVFTNDRADLQASWLLAFTEKPFEMKRDVYIGMELFVFTKPSLVYNLHSKCKALVTQSNSNIPYFLDFFPPSNRSHTMRTSTLDRLHCRVILTPPSFCSYPRIVPASWWALKKLIVPAGRNRGNTVHILILLGVVCRLSLKSC